MAFWGRTASFSEAGALPGGQRRRASLGTEREETGAGWGGGGGQCPVALFMQRFAALRALTRSCADSLWQIALISVAIES